MIAVGHSGYKKDQEIAKQCPDVDVVVGGHSHSYLDANKPVADDSDTSPEAVRGPYPTVVVQSNGKKCRLYRPLLIPNIWANLKYG